MVKILPILELNIEKERPLSYLEASAATCVLKCLNDSPDVNNFGAVNLMFSNHTFRIVCHTNEEKYIVPFTEIVSECYILEHTTFLKKIIFVNFADKNIQFYRREELGK